MKNDLFINNEWTPAASGERFEVINPATEEVLAEVAKGGVEDVDRAVAAARACFESDEWQKMPARDRGKILYKAADLLHERLKQVAELETLHNGKPLFESRIDVSMTVETLRYYAGWTDKFSGDVLPVSGPFFTYTRHEPVGVVGGIVPWNFPLNLAGWKFCPALAAGCTVIIKPASETPLTALAMAEVFADAGLPPGAFNVVPGGGSTAGAAMVRHPSIDKISFTGSTEVGRQLMRDAADTAKRLTLELGGKSPNIIFADADLKAAARGAINGIFYGKGEVCAAGSRLVVEKSVHDQVLEQVAERAKRLVPGDPFAKETRLGAVVSKRQQETVMSYVEAGKA
ncbi:MAG: aldehyde dehydrogenase family protein, partial [Gemmatimonadales bacterium]